MLIHEREPDGIDIICAGHNAINYCMKSWQSTVHDISPLFERFVLGDEKEQQS